MEYCLACQIGSEKRAFCERETAFCAESSRTTWRRTNKKNLNDPRLANKDSELRGSRRVEKKKK